MPRIIVIEDDSAARGVTCQLLQARGHDVVAVDAAGAPDALAEQTFDFVVAGAPDAGHARHDAEPVYLPRPRSIDELVAVVGDLEERGAIREQLDDALGNVTDSPLVGHSPAVHDMLARVDAVASSDAPVLLSGESGTGKDVLARMIHARSERRDGPLVTVNCAAFPETLIEAELFGHERGAFTGALHRRDGRFRAAEGGTLLLDEIDSLSLAAQAKLLRVLEDGRFHPLGTNTETTVDVRLISATNHDLSALVADGRFRGDLYYRIKVLDLDLPPLRRRTGDLPLLVAHFLDKYATGDTRATISPRAWAALLTYPFPGNVRELEHAIQRALVLSRGGDIEIEHLPPEIGSVCCGDPPPGEHAEIRPLSEAVFAFEREYVRRALETTGGNKTRAAQLLGISRKHLWEKLRRFHAADD